MYYVYIICSNTGNCFYKGITADLNKRINEHNQSKSRYTKNKTHWNQFYSKQFETKQQALIEVKDSIIVNYSSLKKDCVVHLDGEISFEDMV